MAERVLQYMGWDSPFIIGHEDEDPTHNPDAWRTIHLRCWICNENGPVHFYSDLEACYRWLCWHIWLEHGFIVHFNSAQLGKTVELNAA